MDPRLGLAATAALLSAGLLPTSAAHAAAAPMCDGHRATIVGTPGKDVLVGTRGADVIAGLAGNDRIDGRGGDDIVCAGAGGDQVTGGPGDDRLFSGPPAASGGDHFGPPDVLIGGPGDDFLSASRRGNKDTAVRLSYARAPRGVTVDLRSHTVTGWGTDTVRASGWVHVVGSAHDDTMTGSAGRDWLEGRAGDDTLVGRGGNDLLEDGRGDDTLLGGRGNDDLQAFTGSDTVRGGPGNDWIYTPDSKPDRLYGGPGRDKILVGRVTVSSDRAIEGGPGRDTAWVSWRVMVGGEVEPVHVTTDMPAGTFTFTDQNVSFPFSSIEQLTADGPGVWTALGTDARDVYETGWTTRLVASMGGGWDRVTGSRKGDTIDGGPGRDTAYPAEGYDVCVSIERDPWGDCEERG
jgi:Ca2+-binding RTX toxin-like protein